MLIVRTCMLTILNVEIYILQSNRCIIAGTFSCPDDLYTFVKENTGQGDSKHKYMCAICGKTGFHRSDVRNHAENIHYPDLFRYNCEICFTVVRSKTALLNHKRTHK